MEVKTVGPSFDHAGYQSARAFYEAHGFLPQEEASGLDWWAAATVIMVKSLPGTDPRQTPEKFWGAFAALPPLRHRTTMASGSTDADPLRDPSDWGHADDQAAKTSQCRGRIPRRPSGGRVRGSVPVGPTTSGRGVDAAGLGTAGRPQQALDRVWVNAVLRMPGTRPACVAARTIATSNWDCW